MSLQHDPLETPPWLRNVLICLSLALAVAVVYWPVRDFDFTNYDDPLYVADNPHVQGGLTLRNIAWAFTSTDAFNWHPLTWLSLMVDRQVWGPQAGGYHLINVVLHIANTLLLFCVLRRMTGASWRSGFVAGLFALHPLHVESVAWVAERKDVLSAFFWMLTLWAYVRYVEQFTVHGSKAGPLPADPPFTGHRSQITVFYCLSLLFFAMGLMAKPMLVSLPFVLLLLDFWPLGRTRWVKPVMGDKAAVPLSRLLMEKLPFFALTIASCGITYWAQRVGGGVEALDVLPMGERIANAVVSYVRYLGKAFWPGGLAVFYPLEKWPLEATVEAAVVVLGVSAWVVWRARRDPHLVVGWLWYLGVLIPVIGLVQVGNQSMADRYTYLPLIGIFMMLAWSLPHGLEKRPIPRMIATACGVVVLIVCAVVSRRQVGYWQNSLTLYEHALAVTKHNHVAHFNLGVTLAKAGKVEDAAGQFEKALRIKPGNADVHYHLGLALALLGKGPEAVSHWEQALRIKPNQAIWHCNLGNVLFALRKVPEAIGHYEQALRIKPDYADAHYGLGLALEQTGKTQDAIRHYEQAMRIKPDAATVQNNLAWLLATLTPAEGGDPVRAVALAERACELTGSQVPAHLDTLAAAYAAVGRFNDAIATAQNGVDLARSAGQQQVVNEIEAHLQLYRNGQAYREVPTPVENQPIN